MQHKPLGGVWKVPRGRRGMQIIQHTRPQSLCKGISSTRGYGTWWQEGGCEKKTTEESSGSSDWNMGIPNFYYSWNNPTRFRKRWLKPSEMVCSYRCSTEFLSVPLFLWLGAMQMDVSSALPGFCNLFFSPLSQTLDCWRPCAEHAYFIWDFHSLIPVWKKTGTFCTV